MARCVPVEIVARRCLPVKVNRRAGTWNAPAPCLGVRGLVLIDVMFMVHPGGVLEACAKTLPDCDRATGDHGLTAGNRGAVQNGREDFSRFRLHYSSRLCRVGA